jgi:DNA oxidative demethylase
MTLMQSSHGVGFWPHGLSEDAQRVLLAQVQSILATAPPRRYEMPGSGRPFSVAMTNAGPLGWVSDRHGYRYAATQPETGAPWPPIPPLILDLWQRLTGYADDPQCCLMNCYQTPHSRLGLHRDADEEDEQAPILSLSLGDTALFALGGPKRSDPKTMLRLTSGAILVLAPPARHYYHGVTKLLWGSSRLLPEGGRINVTLRRVTRNEGRPDRTQAQPALSGLAAKRASIASQSCTSKATPSRLLIS